MTTVRELLDRRAADERPGLRLNTTRRGDGLAGDIRRSDTQVVVTEPAPAGSSIPSGSTNKVLKRSLKADGVDGHHDAVWLRAERAASYFSVDGG